MDVLRTVGRIVLDSPRSDCCMLISIFAIAIITRGQNKTGLGQLHLTPLQIWAVQNCSLNVNYSLGPHGRLKDRCQRGDHLRRRKYNAVEVLQLSMSIEFVEKVHDYVFVEVRGTDHNMVLIFSPLFWVGCASLLFFNHQWRHMLNLCKEKESFKSGGYFSWLPRSAGCYLGRQKSNRRANKDNHEKLTWPNIWIYVTVANGRDCHSDVPEAFE